MDFFPLVFISLAMFDTAATGDDEEHSLVEQAASEGQRMLHVPKQTIGWFSLLACCLATVAIGLSATAFREVSSSVIGPTGPAGTNGATGPAGADGAAGPTGPAGAAGAAGVAGPTGPAGADGATGAGLASFRGGIVIPWTAFPFHRVVTGGGYPTFTPCTAENGGSLVLSSSASVGSASIYIPVTGTWKMTVIWNYSTASGKINIIINSVTTTIDQYASSTYVGTYAWTQSLTGGTTYTVTLTMNGKNAASSNYYIYWFTPGLMFSL